MRRGTDQMKNAKKHKKKKALLRTGCGLLCALQLFGGMYLAPITARAAANSEILMEEYENPKDYTGWYTVTVKVVDETTGDPLEGIFVTLNSKDKGDAGHGPNINGITDYKTDANGLLDFRIYPGPIEYDAIVAEQKGYAAMQKTVGAITKDNTTVTLSLKKKDTTKPSVTPTPAPTSKPSATSKPTDKSDKNDNNNSKPTATPTPTAKPQTTPAPTAKPVVKPTATPQPTPDKTTKDEYIVPGPDNKGGTEDDVTVKPGKDDKGNNNSSIDKDGKVDLPDGGEVIVPTIPDKGDISIKVPEGTKVNPDGSLILPDKDKQTEIVLPGPDKVLGTEDDVIVRPGLDNKGNNNATIDKDGKVDLPDGGEVILPTIPDKGDISIKVPEGTKVNPDGSLILPDKNQQTEIILPGPDKVLGTEDDVIVRPGLDNNGKNNATIDKEGKVDLPDGGEVILPTIPDKGDISIKVPEGTKVNPDGSLILPDKNQQTEIRLPGKDKVLGTEDDLIVTPNLDGNGKNNTTIDADGKVNLPDGGRVTFPSIPDQGRVGVDLPAGSTITADGEITVPAGTKKGFVLPGKDAVLDTEDDVIVEPYLSKKGYDNSVIREDGSILLPDGGVVTYPDGTQVKVPGGTIVLPDGTIIYPGGYAKFSDCMFHWLELLALLLIFVLFYGRYRWLTAGCRKLEDVSKIGFVNQEDPEDIKKLGDQQKRTGILFYTVAMALVSLAMIICYFFIDAHCIVDIPLLVILILETAALGFVLIRREKLLKSLIDEQNEKTEDYDI